MAWLTEKDKRVLRAHREQTPRLPAATSTKLLVDEGHVRVVTCGWSTFGRARWCLVHVVVATDDPTPYRGVGLWTIPCDHSRARSWVEAGAAFVAAVDAAETEFFTEYTRVRPPWALRRRRSFDRRDAEPGMRRPFPFGNRPLVPYERGLRTAWRGLTPGQREAAERRFDERLDAATEAYGPVRNVIDALVESRRAEQNARAREAAAKARRNAPPPTPPLPSPVTGTSTSTSTPSRANRRAFG
ncbi:hypothetical protein [Streptomyces sp. SID3343]|uniref:hypothetical protein n=1 Tax=Streptomyces sp. SID3343 TaxID=2690260 RepID=UPI00136A5C68|nr:hypothetical protein [Streptomyces sp. SID3343]MYW02528.1 hypothetical protein [Streptomyces sp. SID3343]